MGSSRQQRPLRCIVKLGGAAITHKDELETLDVEKLTVTCKQLRQCMISPSSAHVTMDWSRRDVVSEPPALADLEHTHFDMDPFIIIHGAGSFGHFQASRSGVHKGGLRTTLGKSGFVATRISVTKLNFEIVRALALVGIPAVGVSPFSAGWLTHNRVLDRYDISILENVLDAGLTPVLHGDAVLDSSQGCTILSGDVVLCKLAQQLKPTRAVFLTNVPGVFDRPPSEPNAVLLEEIVVHKDGSWEIVRPERLHATTGVETAAAAHDTTGGMATKIAEAATVAMSGVDVYIVEVGTDHALAVLKGISRAGLSQNWVGTIVRAGFI